MNKKSIIESLKINTSTTTNKINGNDFLRNSFLSIKHGLIFITYFDN